ncbi:hypothetical protein SFUMM280S_10607 [Streptomyces fumanus]
MPVLVASDLDRTLIYSAAALALTGPDAEAPRACSCPGPGPHRPPATVRRTASVSVRKCQ